MSRIFFSAAHVVGDADGIDWDATMRYRQYLWSLGLGVADAMDTAQRGMGLQWTDAAELIRRSAAEASGPLACGVGTDQYQGGPIIDAYREQLQVVQEAGAQVILMASRALAASASSAAEYHDLYGRLLSEVDKPVILHWLGDMFDPALKGYWGSSDLDVACDTLLALIHAHAGKIDGIKVSLLDADREIAMRAALPAGVRMYTGDDFNYPSLIESGSDALLGIFDAIAPVAAAALKNGRYQETLEPTVELSRHIFQAPTFHYKTGIVFLAWLNGHQEHFRMVGGYETARSREHLLTLHQLASKAGVLIDPELAAARAAAL